MRRQSGRVSRYATPFFSDNPDEIRNHFQGHFSEELIGKKLLDPSTSRNLLIKENDESTVYMY